MKEFIIKRLDDIEWNFTGAKTQYLTHTYHSYPARFIPQIPQTFIKILTKEGDTLLDPFCGCGTALVESVLLSRNSIGVDLNPLAELISKVKVTPLEPKKLKKFTKGFKQQLNRQVLMQKKGTLYDYIEDKEKRVVKVKLPSLPNRNLSNKFTKESLEMLMAIKYEIDQIEHKDYRDFYYVCFSSTIRTITDSKYNINNPLTIFTRKLYDMIRMMVDFYNRVLNNNVTCKVELADSRKLSFIQSKSIDLVVTSPPYVNALDYHREHMYNMTLLGLDYDFFTLHEIGAHSHFIYNRFRLLTEYWADMFRSIVEINRVLKNDGYFAIVIGSSCVEFESIESYKHFTKMGEKIGLIPIKTLHRNIDVDRKYTSKDIGNINEEFIVVFKKKGHNDYLVQDMVEELWKEFSDPNVRAKRLEISGDCFNRGPRKLTKERLDKNIQKMQDAMNNISKDIRIKN